MACGGIQVQPGCCCSVAFERDTVAMVGPSTNPNACLGNNFLVNALTPENIANLSNYRLLFVGPMNGDCTGVWYQFSTDQNNAIKAWVEAGGRLFASAEYLNCFAVNQTRYNNFLGFLGTGMQLSTLVPAGCNSGCDTFKGVTAAQPIVTGLAYEGVAHAACGSITGGVELCNINATGSPCFSSITFFAAERVGNGIVFAAADSNLTLGCALPNNNCQLFNRMCQWDVADMLNP